MEKKLFKEVDFYGLKIDDKIVGLNNDSTNKLLNYPFKLSLKNCQAIERGYDLDELSRNYGNKDTDITNDFGKGHREGCYMGYLAGFQKALEILGDKKFSEEDVRKTFVEAFQKCYEVISSGKFDNITSAIEWLTQTNADYYTQSLQQTEWDVEVEMEDVFVHSPSLSPNQKSQWEKKPKLDADGCLILKRI